MTKNKCEHNLCSDSTPTLSQNNVIDMATVFKLLGDKSRLSIVIACMEGKKSVSEIIEITGLSQSLISHNLKPLRENRILKSEKDGKFQFYSIDDNHIKHIINDLAHHILEE
ncbi:MAG: ArsR/SmtB family transcription factor [Alphaproteobacteria bacterium]